MATIGFIEAYQFGRAVHPQQWAREAAKAGLRFVFLVQDLNVETLGIRGESAVRENSRKVLLGGFAAKASPVAAAEERPAAVEWRGQVMPVSVSGLLDQSTMR